MGKGSWADGSSRSVTYPRTVVIDTAQIRHAGNIGTVTSGYYRIDKTQPISYNNLIVETETLIYIRQ